MKSFLPVLFKKCQSIVFYFLGSLKHFGPNNTTTPCPTDYFFTTLLLSPGMFKPKQPFSFWPRGWDTLKIYHDSSVIREDKGKVSHSAIGEQPWPLFITYSFINSLPNYIILISIITPSKTRSTKPKSCRLQSESTWPKASICEMAFGMRPTFSQGTKISLKSLATRIQKVSR